MGTSCFCALANGRSTLRRDWTVGNRHLSACVLFEAGHDYMPCSRPLSITGIACYKSVGYTLTRLLVPKPKILEQQNKWTARNSSNWLQAMEYPIVSSRKKLDFHCDWAFPAEKVMTMPNRSGWYASASASDGLDRGVHNIHVGHTTFCTSEPRSLTSK